MVTVFAKFPKGLERLETITDFFEFQRVAFEIFEKYFLKHPQRTGVTRHSKGKLYPAHESASHLTRLYWGLQQERMAKRATES